MFFQAWKKFYDNEPTLACAALGALIAVPPIPLGLLAVDGAIAVIQGAARTRRDRAEAARARAEVERARAHELALERERTRAQELVARASAPAQRPAPAPTPRPAAPLPEQIAAANRRHIEAMAAIALLPIDHATREALELEQEERFTLAVRDIVRRQET